MREKFYARRLNSIEELILSTNIILLCASYENEKLFNEYYIDMLDNKFFINGARGELIDEDYLIKKIESNSLKGVALDVISDENKASNNLQRFLELIEGRNFILTPHIAGLTTESLKKTEEFIAYNLVNTVILNK
jgi:phosphoglycerate dehydrogenase-like enzyme